MDSKLTLTHAQTLVDEWIQTYGVRYFSPLTNMAILTEEVGEVARLMARQYGDQSFKRSDEAKPYVTKIGTMQTQSSTPPTKNFNHVYSIHEPW